MKNVSPVLAKTPCLYPGHPPTRLQGDFKSSSTHFLEILTDAQKILVKVGGTQMNSQKILVKGGGTQIGTF